ncbi:hypothetical protein COTS27_00344 [Spirochaetota bacterium]|nr:hypothetical protein COTS27_00344 [Spirochaetota bacterium]
MNIDILDVVFRTLSTAAAISLAVIAYRTYKYAKSQLALLGKNNEAIKNKNEADYVKEIFNLAEKMYTSEVKFYKIKLKYRSLENNQQNIPDELDFQYETCAINFYNRLESLCFYILNLKKIDDNEELINDIKSEYIPYFKGAWKINGKVIKYYDTEYKCFPFIKALFVKWNIWED